MSSFSLVSDMHHMSELLVLIFGCPVLLCQGKMPRAQGMAAYVWDCYRAFRQLKFGCGCKMLFFRFCGVRQNLCVQSLPQPFPRWPAFLLFASINGCRAGWGCLCLFPVFGWFEWPTSGVVGSTTTNHHRVVAFDSATVSGCDQLVVDTIHAHGGTLDLMKTDVPDLGQVAVVIPIVNSDHCSLLAVISMAQVVPNLCVSRKVFLKHRVNWNTVCGAIQDLPWHNIWLPDNPVEVLNKHVPDGCTLCTNLGIWPCYREVTRLL